MRRKCTNVGVVEDVRQLNGIAGRGRDAQLRGQDELAAYVVRESRDDWKRGDQYARVGVRNANEKNVSLANLLADGFGEAVDGGSVNLQYVELVMGLVTAIPDQGIGRVGN